MTVEAIIANVEKVTDVKPASGRSVATYIGIAAIVVVIVVLIIGAIAFFVRRREFG